MANVTVSTNPSTNNNTLTVNFTTDIDNITDVQLTKDGSNYTSATSFTGTSATFNVASWSNGIYDNCYLKVIYTETATPATYTITRNVTNCTSTGSNTIDTSIITTFQSIVAPNNGYILETLTVSMGGVDYTNRPNVITDIEWEGKPAKQITIENVNGNIVITANATQQSTPSTGGGSAEVPIELVFHNGTINPSTGAEESHDVIGITDFIQASTDKTFTCTTNNCYLDIFIYDSNGNFESKTGYGIGVAVQFTFLSAKKYKLEITPSDWVTQITNSNYTNFIVNHNIQ